MPTKRRSLPELAVELVRLKVDVFMVGGLPGVSAAQGATTTIPIVMTTLGDPVTTGLVASLRGREAISPGCRV
jgi:putative ABC transport system substrate-binding protein